MIKYFETQFGERATAGDLSQKAILLEKIEQLEKKLEIQKARKQGTSTLDSDSDKDKGSEHETDSDVS
jgi:hypothetical protein